MLSIFYQPIERLITRLFCSKNDSGESRHQWIVEHDRSENRTRRLLGFISLFPSGILIGALFVISCNMQLISTLMIISTGFVGISVSVFVPSFLDLSVRYAGRMHGLTNIWTAVAGFVIPYLIGLTVSSAPNEETSWKYIWLVFGIISVLYRFGWNVGCVIHCMQTIMSDRYRHKTDSYSTSNHSKCFILVFLKKRTNHRRKL